MGAGQVPDYSAVFSMARTANFDLGDVDYEKVAIQSVVILLICGAVYLIVGKSEDAADPPESK